MKYNVNVLSKIIRKSFFKIIILSIIMFISLLLVIYFNFGLFSEKNLVRVLGISIFSEKNLLFLIWEIYQIATTFYFSYLFYSYEINNSPEFVLLRKSLKKLFLGKFAFVTLFIILFRTILFLILFMFVDNAQFFNVSLFLKNIIIYICYSLIPLFIILFYNYDIINKMK